MGFVSVFSMYTMLILWCTFFIFYMNIEDKIFPQNTEIFSNVNKYTIKRKKMKKMQVAITMQKYI